ncbi:MAG: recombinase family protein [Armatimonadota bacterium]
MVKSKRVERLQRQWDHQREEQETIALKAVGYLRVSTEEQVTNGYGLETQEQAIRAFALSQGYELVDVVMDAGVSGATKPETREGFRQILNLAEAKAFSVLLVWKFDRLGRNLAFAVTTAHSLLEQHGVVLRSVTEPIDTSTALGQMMFAVFAGMAQQERETITERTLGGKKAKAHRGGFAGGAAPLGYSRDKEGGLLVDEAVAELVVRIFALRQSGKTLQAIADVLDEEGVPTKRGGRWHPGTVRYILDNPKYQGQIEYYFRWKGLNEHVIAVGNHTPLISVVQTG